VFCCVVGFVFVRGVWEFVLVGGFGGFGGVFSYVVCIVFLGERGGFFVVGGVVVMWVWVVGGGICEGVGLM